MNPLRTALRSVLFHTVSDRASDFTTGLGVTNSLRGFRDRVDFLRRHYHPVSVAEVLAAVATGEPLPRRAVLVTIDDAYAPVADTVAPILDDAGVPSLFFVNGDFLDHRTLGTDNLVAFTANRLGGDALQGAADAVRPGVTAATLGSALGSLVPELNQVELGRYRDALTRAHGEDPLETARTEGLYLRSEAVAALPASMAIGSHTSSHVRCRTLTGDDYGREIDANRRRLQELTGQDVVAFSVPYGSRHDLTEPVAKAVEASGHELVFLVEGQLNLGRLDPARLMRVTLRDASDVRTAIELEVFPRVRHVRDLVLRH